MGLGELAIYIIMGVLAIIVIIGLAYLSIQIADIINAIRNN